MKYPLLSLFLLPASLWFAPDAIAQDKMDLGSRARLRTLRLDARQHDNACYQAKARGMRRMPAATSQEVLAMARISDSNAASLLEAAGARILFQRENFVCIAIPLHAVEQIAAIPAVERLQLSSDVRANMQWARAASGVSDLHQGIGLEQPYTGKGVICGIVDSGMDPNHINFLDADGNPRVKMLAHLQYNQNATTDEELIKTKFYDATTINRFTTDSKTTFHGTHTMGIMAGSYNGPAVVAQQTADGGVDVTADMPCPFYGVATESDIAAAACGMLADMFIAYGTDFIIQYAEEMQQPYVINISLGSNTGPHDGSSVIGQFFDLCAEQAGAIICVSSGNEGDMKIAATKTLTAEDTELKTFLEGYTLDFQNRTAYARQGSVTIYSNDDTPFDIQAVIYNKKRGTIAKRYSITIDETTQQTGKYWVSSADYKEEDTDIIETTFGRYFEGAIGLGWNIDPDNGRFYAIVDYTAINDAENNADGNYAIGFIVNGHEGQLLNAYCDGTFSYLSNNGLEDWDDGSCNGSINDLACSRSVIAVGSYNTASQWASVDGYAYKPMWELPEGDITHFTSYGTLNDGRNLPLICAPGATVMSSTNSYYITSTDGSTCGAIAENAEGEQFFWEASSGTSMASPYVAGTIALWLETDPTLTLDDVRDILSSTAIRDEAVLKADPVQAGAGKLDAYAGLKEVLRRRGSDGIAHVSAQGKGLLVRQTAEKMLEVFLAGAESLNVSIIDMAGKTVRCQHTANTDQAVLDIHGLLPGTYVIVANGQRTKCIVP